MKVFKAIGTAVVLTVLCAAIALTLVAGAVRFMALNPAYFKAFLPMKSYCEEMRERITENLDHVALLYGFDEGALDEVVTDDSIRTYTKAMIDALYTQEDLGKLQLPAYPSDGFKRYVLEHTGYSEKAADDFASDCATSVTEDLTAINVGLILTQFQQFRDGTLAHSSLLLFCAGLALTVLMLVFVKLIFAGGSRRAGAVVLWGGCFMGVTLVFVPVMQFLFFDYVGRLNVSVSAFRTILTGFLNTFLYGFFFVLLALMTLTVLMLSIAIVRASRKKRSGKSEKTA
jgi:hypothetical protein